jgi:hypothetical protein
VNNKWSNTFTPPYGFKTCAETNLRLLSTLKKLLDVQACVSRYIRTGNGDRKGVLYDGPLKPVVISEDVAIYIG